MWIRLKNIQVYGYHGAYPHEREHGGRFEIDVEMEADLDKAAKSDALQDTIDYVEIQREVGAIASKSHHLLESLSSEICDQLLKQFPVSEVIVRVRKPGVSAGVVLDTVEVECRKSRG